MINVYDFDKTIYDGDSSVDFYLFCLRKKPSIILLLPIILFTYILYILGLKDKKCLKECFFSFLRKIDNIDEYIEEFWKKNTKKIKKWYLDNKKNDDIIISASPEFLLKPLEKILHVNIIASIVDKKNGKFISENCYGQEKVKRYNEFTKNKINNFYSDSYSDKPMMMEAENSYIVKNDTIEKVSIECGDIKMRKYVKVDKFLYVLGIFVLVIPICMQLFFWFKRRISVPLIIMLLIATFLVIKKYKPLKESEYKKIFNKKKIIFFIILIIVLNLMSGAGGIFQQNWDYHGRNAIFRDLINHSWPVRYDYTNLSYESSKFGNSAFLNYYFAFWLPGAYLGKIIGFKLASIFMLIWQTIFVMLFFYYVIRYMKDIKYRYFFIFIAFGGLNVIGQVIENLINGTSIMPIGTAHIDTSMGIFCMSSFVTQLFWVFNQSLPAWIAVMLYLQQKDYKTCGYFFALLVPFGPFPMIGFLYLIFCNIIFGKDLNSLINFKRFKELLTIPNFLGCISVLPIVFMYTLNESKKGIWFVTAYQNGDLTNTIINYVLFVILEFLVYIVIINKKNYKQVIMCFLFFAIAPLFYIGGADLGNRSTIPLLIVMYLLIIKELNNINKNNKRNYLIQKILIFILIIASFTNCNEFYRSVKYTYLNHKNGYSNFSDSYQTFEKFEGKECDLFITNFVAKNDKQNKVLQFLLR